MGSWSTTAGSSWFDTVQPTQLRTFVGSYASTSGSSWVGTVKSTRLGSPRALHGSSDDGTRRGIWDATFNTWLT